MLFIITYENIPPPNSSSLHISDRALARGKVALMSPRAMTNERVILVTFVLTYLNDAKSRKLTDWSKD